jgi:hypothetical protein
MLKSLNNDKKVFDRLAAKTAYLHAGLESVTREYIAFYD